MAKPNFIFSDKTDSGMTTCLRAMYSGMDNSEKVVVLEDASELSLPEKPDRAITIIGEIRNENLFASIIKRFPKTND